MQESCCLVAQLCPTLCNSMDCSTPSFPVLHHLLEFAQTQVGDAIQHLIFCRPLLLLPSIFPSIRVFLIMQESGLTEIILFIHISVILGQYLLFFHILRSLGAHHREGLQYADWYSSPS